VADSPRPCVSGLGANDLDMPSAALPPWDPQRTHTKSRIFVAGVVALLALFFASSSMSRSLLGNSKHWPQMTGGNVGGPRLSQTRRSSTSASLGPPRRSLGGRRDTAQDYGYLSVVV